MKILKPTAIILLSVTIVICTAFLFFLNSLKLDEAVYLNDQARFNLLIASDATTFKDRLRRLVINNYKEYANIKVINIANLRSTDTSKFDAILILETCIACNDIEPGITKYLEHTTDAERLVFIMTFGDSRDKFSRTRIDAISSASRTRSIEPLYLKITAAIDEMIIRQHAAGPRHNTG
ncbi:MAG: hypothetical protein ABIA75_10115 [Candidatus Neomarinimicrobiota bacterium]